MYRFVLIVTLVSLMFGMTACAAAPAASTGAGAGPLNDNGLVYITNPENAYITFEVFKQAVLNSQNIVVYGNNGVYEVLILDPKAKDFVLAAIQYAPKSSAHLILNTLEDHKEIAWYEAQLIGDGFTKTTLSAAIAEAISTATSWATFFANLASMEMCPYIIIWPGMPELFSQQTT